MNRGIHYALTMYILVIHHLKLSQYQYYSVGLLSNYDKFYEHQKSVVPRPKRKFRDANKPDKRNKIKHPRRLKKGAGEIGDSEVRFSC